MSTSYSATIRRASSSVSAICPQRTRAWFWPSAYVLPAEAAAST